MSRAVPLALLCAIAVLSIDPAVLLLGFSDREEELARRADPIPELAAFLGEVRAHTKPGDSVALLLPFRQWKPYEPLYFRASYLLAGRTVLPVIGQANEVLAQNVARADYVAAWHVRYDGNAVWRGHGGTLVRQR